MRLGRARALLIMIGFTVGACSGSGATAGTTTQSSSSELAPSSVGPSVDVSSSSEPTPTLAPSPTPSPTPPLTSIDALIDAKHPKITASAALAAVKAAAKADPLASGPDTGGDLTKAFGRCQKGDASDSGDPYENRTSYCGDLIFTLYRSYVSTGIRADYDAALAVYNFGFNTLSNVHRRDYWADWVPGYLQHGFGG